MGKRVTVDLRNALEGTDISEKAHQQPQSCKKKLDFSFILCQIAQTGHVPNWTGYNTLLCKESIPQLSKVTYLPIIDASTINAVLQRSTKIADELGLQYVCLVFDEAIYAKIQQIRWKDVTYMDRFVIRMGAFHMAMSFCGAIAKLFGDGGLKVSLSLTSVCSCVGYLKYLASGAIFLQLRQLHLHIRNNLTEFNILFRIC